jgi:hypothetical protein
MIHDCPACGEVCTCDLTLAGYCLHACEALQDDEEEE